MAKDSLLALLGITAMIFVTSTKIDSRRWSIHNNQVEANEIREISLPPEAEEKLAMIREHADYILSDDPPKKAETCIPVLENMPQKVAEWQPIVDEIYERVNPRRPLDKCFVYAMIQAESQGWHYTRGGILRSSAGAVGLMQLLPSTARRFVKNPFDSEQNIRAGIMYLDAITAYLQENDPTWEGKTREEKLDALSAAYNMGEGGYVATINRAQKRGTEPNFPTETREHVTKVSTAYNEYGKIGLVEERGI